MNHVSEAYIDIHGVRSGSSSDWAFNDLDMLTIHCGWACILESRIEMTNVQQVSIECHYGSPCRNTTLYTKNVSKFEIDGRYDDDSLESTNWFFVDTCFASFLYTDDIYRCISSSFSFVNVAIIYGSLELWDCLCSNNHSSGVIINASTVIIDGILKQQSDIENCNKFKNGDMVVTDIIQMILVEQI